MSGVRWPKKSENPNPRRDTSKYCVYHDDVGHNTENCTSLRKEVAWLNKRGLLDGIKRVNRDAPAPQTNEALLEAPPLPTHHVLFNHEGIEVCGLTYSAAKQISREHNLQAPMRPTVEVAPITFDPSAFGLVWGPYHNILVIKIQ